MKSDKKVIRIAPTYILSKIEQGKEYTISIVEGRYVTLKQMSSDNLFLAEAFKIINRD